MKKLLLLCLAATAIITLSSCSMLTRYKCNREFAAKKGMEDAEAGRVAQPGKLEGNSCDGDYSPHDFIKDYNFGYEKKKGEVCLRPIAASLGRKDGQEGNTTRPNKTKFAICTGSADVHALEAIYEKEYTAAFCNGSRAANAAMVRGKNFQDSDFEALFATCKNRAALSKDYNAAYGRALREACTVEYAKTAANDDATNGRAAEATKNRMNICPANMKTAMMKAYDEVYTGTRGRLDKEAAERAAVEAERQRQAKIESFLANTSTSSFPFNLRSYWARCSVANSQDSINVEVDNRYNDQVMIQGNWRIQYYGEDFAKITEDRTQEAVLITPQNKKSFQKLTLPRGARYCRADFLQATNTTNSIPNPIKIGR